MDDPLAQLIATGRVEQVEPDPEVARLLVEESQKHLDSADRIAPDDPNGSYQLLYDAARKAIAAHMLARGLRIANRPGAHETAGRYARASIGDGEMEASVRQFDRMRRTRNRSEYELTFLAAREIAKDLAHARRIVQAVERDLG